MANSNQARRLGVICIFVSALIFGCSVWFEKEGSAYKYEATAINLVAQRSQQIAEWMCPPSSFFVQCKDLASRCFSLGVVASCLGMLFLQRGRTLQRIDLLEKELQAMRTLLPR